MIGGQSATLQTTSAGIRTWGRKHQRCRPKIQSASSDRSGGTEEHRATEAESDAERTAENGVGHSVHRRDPGKRLEGTVQPATYGASDLGPHPNRDANMRYRGIDGPGIRPGPEG